MEVKGVTRKRKHNVSFDPKIVEKEVYKHHPKTPLKESPKESNQMDNKSAIRSPVPMEF